MNRPGNPTAIEIAGTELSIGAADRAVSWSGALVQSLRRSRGGVVGVVIVVLVLSTAVLSPVIAPHDPLQRDLSIRFKPPGFRAEGDLYRLGTDHLGRDIMSRTIEASRVSVLVGIVSVGIAGAIGVAYGIVAGFYGGWLDNLLMRIADAVLAVPFLVLAVAVAGIMGAGLTVVVAILVFTSWVQFARIIRGEVLSVREKEYIQAAQAIGVRDVGIMVKHVLPNVIASSIVLSALQVASAILTESALSFLGLGVQPPVVTWGTMLSDGRAYIGSAWWMSTYPGVAITITILGIVLLGDWLRDVLDPRLRGIS